MWVAIGASHSLQSSLVAESTGEEPSVEEQQFEIGEGYLLKDWGIVAQCCERIRSSRERERCGGV